MSETFCTTNLSKEEEFKRLQIEGRQLSQEGKLVEALKKFELAKRICPAPKVLQRIEKLKEYLNSFGNNLSRSTVSANSGVSCNESLTKSQITSGSKSSDSDVKDNFTASKVLNDIRNVENSHVVHLKSGELTPQSQSKFRQLKGTAKELSYEGQYEAAIKCFRKALKIYDCPKVKRYIQELQLAISNEDQLSKENVTEVLPVNQSNIPPLPVKEERTLLAKSNDHQLLKENMKEVNDMPVNQASIAQLPVQEEETSATMTPKAAGVEEKLAEVKILYEDARNFAVNGKLVEALKLLKKAHAIHETKKVEKQMIKLEELLAAETSEPESDDMINITTDFAVFHEIHKKLYPYQREGVAWMWKLNKMRRGGVLGDDMGLGKTFQVIAFISGMIDADLMKHVLIIMPVSLLPNWEREFKKWCPGISVHVFHGASKKERERNLLRVQRRGHVLLTSYGMVVSNVNHLSRMDDREFIWDYCILDEGHKIKNPTKTTKAVHDIAAKNRLVLTGTPIQNSLRELWSLYDFVHQGTLLGSLKTFKLQYETPITRSREKDATAGEKRLGTEMAENLKSLINPYFLRRSKDEIWGNTSSKKNSLGQLEDQMEKMVISTLRARKNDLILWTFMSDPQIEIYKSFLHSDAVKSILMSKRSPLVELTTLKKICDHPRLLSRRACSQLGLDGDLQGEDLMRELDDEASASSTIDNVTDETLLLESGKLKLVIELLQELRETGHRTLVFSLSRKILDMIHRILTNRKWKVMRLDGTIAKMEERERRIQKFQNDPSYFVFLLTTQVGGVGITLTAADRVIIYDPSWNPATDAQAVDRVYRIGQQKDVVVYRLITCGSVEEKIYRRQVFKDSITRQATGGAADPYRYFSKQELRELFSLENAHYSATQVQLAEMHSERNTDDELEKHIAYLQSLNVFGISDHDLMFSRNIQDHTEDNDSAAVSYDYIKKQVAMAHQLIQAEAAVVADGIRIAGTYSRPYQETIPLKKQVKVPDGYKPPVLPEVIDLTERAQNIEFPFQSKLQPKSPSIADCIDLTEELSSPMKNKEKFNFDIVTAFKPSSDERHSLPMKVNNKFSPEIASKPYSSSISNESDSHYFTPARNLASNYQDDLKTIKHDVSIEESNCSDTPIKIEPHDSVKHIGNISKQGKALDSSIENNEHLLKETKSEITPQLPTTFSEAFNQGVQLPKETEKDIDVVPSAQTVHNTLDYLKVAPEFQEKFQNNLTLMMDDDLNDMSFNNEMSTSRVSGRRKSCARKSIFAISDSDNSEQGSCPPSLNTTANLDDGSDHSTHASDSSNSVSISFVPDSVPSTPHIVQETKFCLQETPSNVDQKPFCFSESTPVKIDSSSVKKFDDSVRRITPLKVARSWAPQNPSFVQALAASPILTLTPVDSPKLNTSLQTLSRSVAHISAISSSEHASPIIVDDSPIKFIRKKKFNRLNSESEESGDECETVTDLIHNESLHDDIEDSKSVLIETDSDKSVGNATDDESVHNETNRSESVHNETGCSESVHNETSESVHNETGCSESVHNETDHSESVHTDMEDGSIEVSDEETESDSENSYSDHSSDESGSVFSQEKRDSDGFEDSD